jgi:hypothetical protein
MGVFAFHATCPASRLDTGITGNSVKVCQSFLTGRTGATDTTVTYKAQSLCKEVLRGWVQQIPGEAK